MKTGLTIVPLLEVHWADVRRIYQEGIDAGQATFETPAPDWERFDASHTLDCRLVALDGARIVAWRPVYRGVAEASLYVTTAQLGQGIGSAVMTELVRASEECGCWTLLAKIFPENPASRALTRKFGFREVGVLRRIGQHHGVWRDVLLLERRIS